MIVWSDVLEDWELVVDGPPRHGHTAVVVPVLSEGRPAVLKVDGPQEAERHEALALRHWHGRGAVRLLRADPRRSALLLERLSTEDLTGLPDVEACEVVAGLYGRLHVPAPPRLPLLSAIVGRWVAEPVAPVQAGVLPRRLLEQARHLARAFASDRATDGVLVHGNLHHGTVLAGDREPWLAIGPRSLSGDPHHEVAPLLTHRWEEVASSGDVRRALRRRFHTAVDVAGLDDERARDWVIVREAHAATRAPGDGSARASVAVAVIKAVQD